MKKTLVAFVICIVVLLSGCGNELKYTRNDPALYTEAVYSLLGVRSYFDDIIYVVEKDDFGRQMFVLKNRGAVMDTNHLTGLFISQDSNLKYVYYYPDINYVVSDEAYSEGGVLPFSSEQIEELKIQNDWNQPFDESKWIQKKITRMKDDYIISENDAYQIIKENHIFETVGNDVSVIFLDIDANGQHIFFVEDRNWINEENKYVYYGEYAVVLHQDGTFDENTCVIQIENMFEYREQLIGFKTLNSWKSNYYLS